MTELQKRLKAVLAELETLAAKATPTEDEVKAYNSLLEEASAIKAQKERNDKVAEFNDWAKASAGMLPVAKVESITPDGVTTLTPAGNGKVKSYLLSEEGDMLIDEKTLRIISSPEYKAAFQTYLRQGIGNVKAEGLKVLQEAQDSYGGYLVPEEILARMVQKDPAPTQVAGRVTRLTTSRDRISMPRVNYSTDDIYTTGMRVTWTGEIPAAATAHRVTQPVFGQISIPIYTAMMSLPISRDMLEDTAFPLLSWCSGKFSETADLLYENMILNGTGANQPKGILNTPNGTDEPATVNSGAASALTGDGVISLAYAVPEQYDGNSAFVFNKTSTALAISKLKDGDGRYLWADNSNNGLTAPAVRNRDLIGYPVVLSAFMPDVGTNTYPIIFGDLRGYYLVTRLGMSIEVLRELYAETNQVLILGKVRFGGMVAEAWKMKIQKVAA